MQRGWTTIPAVARALCVDRETVRGWVNRGHLRALAVPSRHYTDERPRKTDRAIVRIYEDDLVAFLKRYRGGPTMRIPSHLLRRDY